MLGDVIMECFSGNYPLYRLCFAPWFNLELGSLVSGSVWLTLGHLFILEELGSPLTSPGIRSEAQGLNSVREISKTRKSHRDMVAENREIGDVKGCG